METELYGRDKTLPYKVKAMSRESPSQKASLVLDADLRSHWSTATNTKEWILLELNEPCLLSHIRIHNKSVLEWEISAGLRYKPESFVKVRQRCEAPRRDMVYSVNYTPCRYVRISCLRGNPIAIFFIQLFGVSVIGLEPEFQPVVSHLLPHITSNKQDVHDTHLQLLKDMTNRLHVFLPQLEADLNSFSDDADANLRFLAMLAGPFYPILFVVNERVASKSLSSVSEAEVPKNSQQSSAITVSSNFAPRKSRITSPILSSTSSSMVFRADAVLMLLRKAQRVADLKTVCKTASSILQKLLEPDTMQEVSTSTSELIPGSGDETVKNELLTSTRLLDYSNLFGSEFQLPDDEHLESSYLNILDLAAVEEGILHVLFACASQPSVCSRLAGVSSNFGSELPLIQTLLPALRPLVSSHSNVIDDNFSQWKQPIVQQALNQILVTSSLPLYRPLLHACAGYLMSYSPSHAKASSILIDLCCSVLAPWTPQIIARVDLVVELLEDLLGIIQGAKQSLARAQAALKYILLAISGHMDDILGKYKAVKHKILFLVEMLEPFINPTIASYKSTIAFGDLASTNPEKMENNCVIALNVIRTAVLKPAVLVSLESEWRRGSVAPSILLAILEPRIQLPLDIDLRTSPLSEPFDPVASSKPNNQDEFYEKTDMADSTAEIEALEDANLLFAPPELRSITPTDFCNDGYSKLDPKETVKIFPNQFHADLVLDTDSAAEYINLRADHFQISNYQDSEIRASEFQRFAIDLHSNTEITKEGHDAAVDALLLAAECYINPFFMISSKNNAKLMNYVNMKQTRILKEHKCGFTNISGNSKGDFKIMSQLEKKRDRIVLQILLKAAELDRKYQEKVYGEFDEHILELSAVDVESADAITLVRQNQSLLCNFITERLQREETHSMQEVLMQSLVFFMNSATKLYCKPDHIIDIVLKSGEYLNGILTSFYHQFKEGNLHLDPETVHRIQRRWILLKRLVIASSNGERSGFAFDTNSGYNYTELVPPSSWTNKISTFSGSKSPLVRFLGWMAVSRSSQQYIKDRIYLASDLHQLTYCLSIFADELAVVDNVVNRGTKSIESADSLSQECENESLRYFHVVYPDLHKFFPDMKKQFGDFGETVLEAVGLQLKSLPSTLVPDILCWFSELCLWPFSQSSSVFLKGYAAKNAKVVILYVLEAIITEHMEAMVPETPRLVQVLLSLCRASYCDVSFVDSVLRLLKPIISYSLSKVSVEEMLLHDDTCLNFESLCFDELFSNIKPSELHDRASEKLYNRGLTIFILASIVPDISIKRKREMLKSLLSWAEFSAFEPTSSFYDYLYAFENVMLSCKLLLVQTLKLFGAPTLQSSSSGHLDSSLESGSWFVRNIYDMNVDTDGRLGKKVNHLSLKDIAEFCKDLEILISKLSSTVDSCWNLHPQLAKKLAISLAECFICSRCLSSMAEKVGFGEDNDSLTFSAFNSDDQIVSHWRVGLEGISNLILTLQEKSCWEVASVMLDCLLAVPHCFGLGDVVNLICSALKRNSSHAPNFNWRLNTDKWLSVLFSSDISSLNDSESSLVDFFCILLGHPEPEQRFIALRHLGKLVGQEMSGRTEEQDCSSINDLLVPRTWDLVIVMASSDTSLHLRNCAMALLVNCIPFAKRHQLQSLMAAADSVHGLTLSKLGQPLCEGTVLRLSLALIAGACLYSPPEDISLIPQHVWRNIEMIGLSKSETGIADLEKRVCEILCRLKNEEDDEAKVALREVLAPSPKEKCSPNFASTREAILQVMANLTSVESYFDFFSDKVDREAVELEEAEIELEILQKEGAVGDVIISAENDDSRLHKIKDSIRSIEKSRLREKVSDRWHRKLLLRHKRQKDLEEAAVREAELLQELDRERATEAEKEIERLRLLEAERAKTRELQNNLEIEKERQTQRELQRELEQVESGVRSSRRDFSSSHSGRPRDKYRERENGRPSEGSSRATVAESPGSLGTMTILSGSARSFSGQPPTILQSRDRSDDFSSGGYEENFDGSRDSGDTGSAGDPELASAFDGSRHGSRGGKPRPAVDRRERGKWERKH